MTVRVALWAAVSSKPQTAGDSLPNQLNDGARFAADRGYHVTAALIVPGESRYLATMAEMIVSIKDVPENVEIIRAVAEESGLASDSILKPMNAYAALQELIATRGMDVLWCRDFDRLGRTDPLISEILFRCRAAGIQVYVERMPPTGQTVGDLYTSAFARAGVEHEIMRLRQRHVEGFDTRVARGQPVGSGIVFPYRRQWLQHGPRLVSQAVLVPEWGEVYHWIIDVTLNRTHTAQEQAAILAARVPDLRWTTRKLQETLRNSFALGLIVRRRHYTERDNRQQRLVLLATPGPDNLFGHPLWPEIESFLLKRIRDNKVCLVGLARHEPAISPEKWVELQRFLAQRSDGRRPPARNRLWSGLLYCGRCGAIMYAGNDKPHSKTGEYVCSNRKRWHTCDNTYVMERVVNEQVAEWLDALAASVQDEITNANDRDLPAPPNLEKELADLKRRRERITALYETGRIEVEEWDRRVAEIASIEAGLRLQIASAIELRQRQISAAQQRQALAGAAPKFNDNLALLSAPEANRWLRQLFRRIYIDNRVVTRIEV